MPSLSAESKYRFSVLQLSDVILQVVPSVLVEGFSKVMIRWCGFKLGYNVHVMIVPSVSPLTKQGYGSQKSMAVISLL